MSDGGGMGGGAVAPIEIGVAFDLRFDTGVRVPEVLDLPFDDAIVGEGWHQWETSDAGSFRWMGKAEVATVAFVVDRRRDLAVSLGIYMAMAPSYDAAVSIRADGGDGPVAHVRTGEGLSFVLPARPGDPAVTVLEIFAGAGMVREPDTRRLSLSFSHLRVRPVGGGAYTRPVHLALRDRMAEQLRSASGDWPLTNDGRPVAVLGAVAGA